MTNNSVDAYESLKWEDTTMKKLQVMKPELRGNYWKNELYWAWKAYNVEFMYEFWFDLISDYEQMIVEYNQSQRNAASSDLSPQLKKMNWLMETVKTTSQSSSRVPGKKELGLEYRLRKIKDKQCI